MGKQRDVTNKEIFKWLVKDVMGKLTLTYTEAKSIYLDEKYFWDRKDKDIPINSLCKDYILILYEHIANYKLEKIKHMLGMNFFICPSFICNKEVIIEIVRAILVEISNKKRAELGRILYAIQQNVINQKNENLLFTELGQKIIDAYIEELHLFQDRTIISSEVFTTELFVLTDFMKKLEVKINNEQILILEGEPGSGKYSMVAEYAKRQKSRYDHIVFVKWCDDLKKTIANIQTRDDTYYTADEKDPSKCYETVEERCMRKQQIMEVDESNNLIVFYDLVRPLTRDEMKQLRQFNKHTHIVLTSKVSKNKGNVIRMNQPERKVFGKLLEYYWPNCNAENHNVEINRLIEMSGGNIYRYIVLLKLTYCNVNTVGVLYLNYQYACPFGFYRNNGYIDKIPMIVHGETVLVSMQEHFENSSNYNLLTTEEKNTLSQIARFIGDGKESAERSYSVPISRQVIMKVIKTTDRAFFEKCMQYGLLEVHQEQVGLRHVDRLFFIFMKSNCDIMEVLNEIAQRLASPFTESEERIEYSNMLSNYDMLWYVMHPSAGWMVQFQNGKCILQDIRQCYIKKSSRVYQVLYETFFPTFILQRSIQNSHDQKNIILKEIEEEAILQHVSNDAFMQMIQFPYFCCEIKSNEVRLNQMRVSAIIDMTMNVHFGNVHTSNSIYDKLCISSTDLLLKICYECRLGKDDEFLQSLYNMKQFIADNKIPPFFTIYILKSVLLLGGDRSKLIQIRDVFSSVINLESKNAEEKFFGTVFQEMLRIVIDEEIDWDAVQKAMRLIDNQWKHTCLLSLTVLLLWKVPSHAAIGKMIETLQKDDLFLHSDWNSLLQSFYKGEHTIINQNETLRSSEKLNRILEKIHVGNHEILGALKDKIESIQQTINSDYIGSERENATYDLCWILSNEDLKKYNQSFEATPFQLSDFDD